MNTQTTHDMLILVFTGKMLTSFIEDEGFEYDTDRKQYQKYVHSAEQITDLTNKIKKHNYFNKVRVITQAEWENEGRPFEQREPEVTAFLRDYNGDHSFFLSLKRYYEKNGKLSPAQLKCIKDQIVMDAKDMVKDSSAPVVAPVVPAFTPTYEPGTVIEVRGNIAKKIAKAMEHTAGHRNLEILHTLRETHRGIMVRVRYSPRFGTNCMKCGLPLDTDISRATGVGPVCAKHYGIPRKSLLETEVILHIMESNIPKKEVEVFILRDQIKGALAKEVKVETVPV